MRAITWTQVAQYIILIVAYMIPVVWLSVKQTNVPVPQAIYGAQLEKVTAKEKQLIDDLQLVWMCGLPGHTPGDLDPHGHRDTTAAPKP